MRRVVMLGDSLSVSPSRSMNFGTELQKRLDTVAPNWILTNMGVSGDTSSQGLTRFDADVPGDTNILVLELGANDGLRGVQIATIERNLSTMIERAHSRGIRVLLCGMEAPPAHGWNYTVEFHNLFPRLAQRYAVALVPFLLAGVALDPDMNGNDGIHPNAAGARHIAENVWPYLEPLVIAEQGVAPR
jgi:acyl-CoA thioesterase I